MPSAANTPANPAIISSNPPTVCAASLHAIFLKTFTYLCRILPRPCRRPEVLVRLTPLASWRSSHHRTESRLQRRVGGAGATIFSTRYLWHFIATICRGILLTGTTGGSTLSIHEAVLQTPNTGARTGKRPEKTGKDRKKTGKDRKSRGDTRLRWLRITPSRRFHPSEMDGRTNEQQAVTSPGLVSQASPRGTSSKETCRQGCCPTRPD